MSTEAPASPLLKTISRYLGYAAFILPFLVMCGWVFNIEFLKRGISDAVAMNPFAAICFMLCAFSLDLQNRKSVSIKNLKYAKRMALFVALASAAKLAFMIARLDFFADTFLFHDQLFEPTRNQLNHLSPNTAACFIFIGLSLFWLDTELGGRRRPAQYFSIFIMFVSILTLYGYVYGVKFLYGLTNFIPMAFYSGLCFLLLAVAILFARPDRGSMAIIIGDTSAEVTLLRLAAFIIPLGIGWLKLKGEKLGYYSPEFGTALFAVITYALAMFLLGRRSVVNFKLRAVRRAAQEELKKSHDRFMSFFNQSPEAKSITEVATGKFLYVNQAFLRLFGRKEKDVIGKTAVELDVLDEQERNKIIRGIDLEGKSKAVEIKLRDSAGEIKDVIINVEIIEADEKKCFATNYTDITSRKKAEEEVRQANSFLGAILENIPDMIFVKDAKELRFVRFNKAGENLLGLSRADLIGKNDYDFFPKEQADFFTRKDREVIAGKMLVDIPEEPIDTRNGRRWLHTKKITLTDGEGNPAYLIGISEDITEKKLSGKALAQNEELLYSLAGKIEASMNVLEAAGKNIPEIKKLEEFLAEIRGNLPGQN